MRLGIFLPHLGPLASPAAIIATAQRAEALGYDSLWVTDRVLFPLAPRTPYPGTPDGALPDAYRYVLDPLGALTFAAAHTSRIGLGTSVLDMPYYNPVLLARSLAGLDILSGGRLRVGLGLGWSEDEFEAVGASLSERGRRADEFLAVLKAAWADDPVAFSGAFYRIPPSIIGAKPAQRSGPPIYLAAFAPGALRRVATLADGWHPVSLPLEAMAHMFAGVQAMAVEAGRQTDDLALVVRANLHLTADPIAGERGSFAGSLEQIGSDIAATRALGAAEICFDLTFSPGIETLSSFLDLMEQLHELAMAPATTA